MASSRSLRNAASAAFARIQENNISEYRKQNILAGFLTLDVFALVFSTIR